MSRRSREGGVVVAEEQEQVEATEKSAAEAVAEKCDELKSHLKAAAVLSHELEYAGLAKRFRSEHDKMDDRKAKLVKRVQRDGSREEREAKKAARREERIAKLRRQLAELTEEEED